MPRPLNEQVVVVTGASSGVGRACARAFAERGAKVALLARNEEALEAAARAARRSSARSTWRGGVGGMAVIADGRLERGRRSTMGETAPSRWH